MNWAIISLLGLAAIIIIANWKNINVGLVGLAMALLLGTLGGLKPSQIYGSFNLQLFIRLLSMQTLIVIARSNGTLTIISDFFVRLTRGNAIRLLPIMLYIATGISGFFNLGLESILTPLMFAMAFEFGFKDPMKLCFVSLFVFVAFSTSPFNMTGQNLLSYAEAQGYTLNLIGLSISQMLFATVLFFGFYFGYGWHKIKIDASLIDKTDGARAKIGFKQFATLMSFVAFIFANLVLKLDMMITPICASIILLCIGCAEPDKVIKGIPWSTLIMIGGMTVYVGIIKAFGGVDLISGAIASIASPRLAPAVMCLLCSVMSTFASGNGVVVPTMTSSISTLAEAIPGVDVQALFHATNIGAGASGISPMSTIGAQSLAYYAGCYNPTPQQEKSLFNRLVIYTGVMVAYWFVVALIGAFTWFV